MTTLSPAVPVPKRGRTLSIRLAGWLRWLHIYTSMLGLAVTLFFSVTGLTLNHPGWFWAQAERRSVAKGELPVEWVKADLDEEAVRKLEVVERLRGAHGVHGALADFRAEEQDCSLTFKGPGYAADAFIDRQTGRYELTQTFYGPVAILNDLHKGRDTGAVWSVLIDVSAVLLTLISLTGLALLFYLKLRRVRGVLVGLAGALVTLALAWWFVA